MANGQRELWGSRAGFILAATGSAVGLGNIWKFPFMAGMSGGAAFVLVYLVCVALIGFPVMLLEFALGRRTRKDPVGAYRAVDRTGLFWVAGAIGVIAGFVILSFYSVVAGWCLGYVFKALNGTFASFTDSGAAAEHFGAFAANPTPAIGFHAVFMLLCIVIVSSGVKCGIERAAKFLMPALLVILLVLVFRGLTLPGAGEGVAFLFSADLAKIDGWTTLKALGHAFFTLSLGMGAMITYGSYLPERTNLLSAALLIAFLDTLVALLAGLAIFTAVFAFGLAPDGGPGLIFNVLPVVFSQMPGGVFFGFLFFVLLSIAALTSGISLLEVVTAYFVDERGWARRRAALGFGVIIFLVGLPCALSVGGPLTTEIFGRSFFDAADYLSFTVLLPLGGLLITLFTLTVWGVGDFIAELKKGSDVSLSIPGMRLLLVVVAVLVLITFWAGFAGKL